jgi:hypothetical protein
MEEQGIDPEGREAKEEALIAPIRDAIASAMEGLDADERATALLYGLLCDVVQRAWQRWPVDSYKDDPIRHTSDYARAGAARIMKLLGIW